MKNSIKNPIIKKDPQFSTDTTGTENMGGRATGIPLNNPMDGTDMMFTCFERAIKQDVVLSDTLARKNPFKSGPNPKPFISFDGY